MASVLSYDVGTRNLASCAVGADGAIRAWSVDDVLAEAGCLARDCRKVPLERLVGHLLAYLHRREASYRELGPFVVAVEQQPSSRFCPNTKTKVLSHVLQAYFTLAFPDARVVFVNPKVPKRHLTEAAEIKKIKSSSKRYSLTKKLAVTETRRLLQSAAGGGEWAAWFETQKKKDDLADAYLQALHVLRARAAEIRE